MVKNQGFFFVAFSVVIVTQVEENFSVVSLLGFSLPEQLEGPSLIGAVPFLICQFRVSQSQLPYLCNPSPEGYQCRFFPGRFAPGFFNGSPGNRMISKRGMPSIQGLILRHVASDAISAVL